MAVALTSDHVGTNPTVTSEWPALTSDLLVRKVVALTSMQELILHQNGQHSHLTYSSERHALTYDLVGTKSYTLIKMAPSPRMSYLVTDQVPPLSRRVAVALTSNLLIIMASTHI